MQGVVEALPPAQRYCTDQSSIDPDLMWSGGSAHISAKGKQQTHTRESLNTNLRHYRKRLCRRTRAYSKRIPALRKAVRLCVW
jgi:IS1 family transposase